jgi:hypothetical protein
LADETKATGAAAPPETDDYADYAAWRAAQEAAAADHDDDTPSEAPAAKPEAESAEEADASEVSPEGDEEESESDEQPGAEQPKRKGGFQRRIDKLTREKRELEARIAALEAKLAGGAGTGAPPGEAEHQARPAEAPGKPRPEDFDTYEAYTEALTDWKLEQRERERARQDAERRVFESWMERIDAARKAHPDFDEVVDSDTPVSAAMQQAILESDQGAEIAYWLGKHPEEAERISKLPPIAAIREIGRIEALLSSKKEPSPKPKATITRAPKPVTPVSGGKASLTGDIYDPALAEDYTAWERARRAELKRKAS